MGFIIAHWLGWYTLFMIKAVIFDFFDVIRTDAYKSWLNLHGYKREGKFLEVNEKMDRGDILADEFLRTLGELSGQAPEEIFAEMEEGATVDQDVLALIESLRAHYKIGLLSNSPSAFLRGLLAEHDLEKYFDIIVISSEVGLIKPHPEMFQYILGIMEVQPDEAIFIDDNQSYVDGARAVGIKGVLYTNADSLRRDLAALGARGS